MRSQVIMPIMLLWAIGTAIIFKSNTGGAMGITLVCGLVPYLTITSDETSMYLRLALSQPNTRKGYVWSKYFVNLVLIGLLALYLLVARVTGINTEAQGSTLGLLLSLSFPMLITAFLLPAVFYFGSGKTRLLYMGIIIGVTMGFSSGNTFVSVVARLASTIESLSATVLVLGGLVLLAGLMTGSILLSLRIVQKKDY